MPSVKRDLIADEAEEQDLRHLDDLTQGRLHEFRSPVLPMQSLRRTGQRPFAFNGVGLGSVCGVTPLLPFWYELNLHRTVIDSFVSDVRLFNKGADQADIFRVAEHDDLDAAFGYFERYDPSHDIAPSPPLPDPGMSTTQLALRTAHLQMLVDRITDHYRGLVIRLFDDVRGKVG